MREGRQTPFRITDLSINLDSLGSTQATQM